MDRELCRTPARFRRMARRTIRTYPQLLMVRIRRLIEIALVAADAFHRRAGISVGVAVDARDRSMRTSKREICLIVIKVTVKISRYPGIFIMTCSTSCTESVGLMVGVSCLDVIR